MIHLETPMLNAHLHTWNDLSPKYTFVVCTLQVTFSYVCEGACNYPLEHRGLCLLKFVSSCWAGVCSYRSLAYHGKE